MSRDAILARLRQALPAGRANGARRDAVNARLASPPKHIIPARVNRPRNELIDLFKSFLATQNATVLEVTAAAGVPNAIADYLRSENLPAFARMGTDPFLATLPWHSAPGLTRQSGRADPDDPVGLSRAAAGVAETGTLMIASGAENPVTLAFLPDTHVIVVGRESIVGSYEDGYALVMKEFGKSHLPRTLNMISGPSRTGDIGGHIVMGAHGPRRLAVLIVGEESSNRVAR